MNRFIRTTGTLIAAATLALVTLPSESAFAVTEPITLTPICQAVPGSYPGATISVGGITEHVPSIGNLNVCLYRYAGTVTGAPLPQTFTGCGTPCFKIDSPGTSAQVNPYIQVTYTSDGNPGGFTYVPPPVSVGYTEPICVSLGTPAPQCTNATINLSL